MNARALDDAADRIHTKRRRFRESIALAGVSALFVWPALANNGRVAIAWMVGVAFEAVAAAWFALSRRGLIERLSLDPDAYALPEVAAYGRRLVELRRRRVLAQGIRKMVREALRPDNLYLGERVVRYARELEALARDLAAPGTRVHPASVARCRQLLTEAAESPLYNPRLPADDIPQIVRRIRAGMEP